MKKALQFFRSETFKGFGEGMVWVALLVFCVVVVVYFSDTSPSATSYGEQNPRVFKIGQGPVGLLVSVPMEGCSTVGQIGLYTQDIPVGEKFVYTTQAYGGFCGAEMLLKGTTDIEIVSAKPVPWAAVYNIKVNGLHTSTGVVFSYGDSIVAGSETATSPDGAVYTATPIAVWIFSLPSTDPVDLGTAELALPQSFPGTTGYYPVIQRSGEYGLSQYSGVLDAILQYPPVK